MAEIKDLDELKVRLNKAGSLAELLDPQDFAPEGLVADTLAQKFKKELNPTQMRKVFHAFKQIERGLRGKGDEGPLDENLQAQITLLGPDLAYATGRGLLPKPFYNVLKLCLANEKMQTVVDFRRLIQLLSAILAYQKYYT